MEPVPVSPPSPPVPTPAPVPPVQNVTLWLSGPWTVQAFVSGVPGWPTITAAGAEGPAASADAVIEAAVKSNLTVERR